MGSPAEGDRFFDERWPEARAVSDERKALYAAFGLTRGSIGQVAGPRVWLPGLKAILRHGLGKPVGDPLMLSGWFLVAGDGVAWEQRHADSAEERRYGELDRAFRVALEGRTPPGSED